MADEQKVTPAATNANAEAEKDVQNVLAELKDETAGEAAKPSEQPAEEKKGEAPAEDAEEARIVAAAAKLGEQSAKAEEQKEGNTEERDTRGRGNRRNNVKFDPSTLEVTDNHDEIRKQVEFYFSDSNLPMDKFLLSKVGGSSNRPVPLELLHSFKRMRRFQPFSAIVEALKSSETLELTDNDTCVRRKVPLPESVTENPDPSVAKVFEDQAMSRSIYAKGFGEETPTTQIDIEAFFAPYGPVNAIRLRRTHDRIFKGSVFVEFATEEKQKEFLALDPKPQWKGQDLLIKSKKDYCEEKVRDIEAGRIKPSRGRGRGGFRGRGRGGPRGGDKRDWRERRAEDQKNGFGKPQGEQRREVQKDARGVPVVQSSADDATAGQKRTREDEAAANGEHPAKKVDAKE
ncbi:la protein homolog [Aspergillus lentulus]|uniref:La protein homolog n=1 Tax=Aspergillus lentulus TaxID=293939 RepID=A0AAN5YTS0_ASPLE|nr:la protein homolog [Aspergillus lentulus]KAF4158619.1 hypothetical protein CNMCM6069_003696 [Aspergillus lentulus]KAF4168361.1 hypothetical protein CNMCM6936_002817 [Aspergillus lentulus]KAF4178906.1 hypothetical protein CNMCM8060_004015 [Aspergillus lentulus]KAF4187539.1 hypothetical protein CNMCM7927_004012 [Aspergillus lentulus]KAF4196688.1 hypothetical protein CNMCM8694_004636 [Aspergillus lentulus]